LELHSLAITRKKQFAYKKSAPKGALIE